MAISIVLAILPAALIRPRPICMNDQETTRNLTPRRSGFHRSKNPQFVGARNIAERNNIVRKIASKIFNAGYMLLSKLLGCLVHSGHGVCAGLMLDLAVDG